MSRLRALFVCLLMLALPFQGFAAAAMVACGLPANDVQHVQHAQQSHHAGDSTQVHHDAGAHPHDDGHGGTDHSCSACSVCHSAALLDMPWAIEAHPLPDARPAPALQALASLAPTLPDKPPRA